ARAGSTAAEGQPIAAVVDEVDGCDGEDRVRLGSMLPAHHEDADDSHDDDRGEDQQPSPGEQETDRAVEARLGDPEEAVAVQAEDGVTALAREGDRVAVG